MNALTVAVRREVNVPFFPGFYYSALSEMIDHEEEQLVEYLAQESDDPRFAGKPADAIADALYWTTGHSFAYLKLAEAWADLLAHETGEHLAFTEMTSPREYNFTTDQLFVDATLATVRAWMREVDLNLLTKCAEARHTSCSGFISFYAPDWTTWGPVEEWDHNQLGTLLCAVLETRGDLERLPDSIADSLYEYAYEALDFALDLDAAAARLQ